MKNQILNIFKNIGVTLGVCAITLISIFSISLKNRVASGGADGEPKAISTPQQLANFALNKALCNMDFYLTCDMDMDMAGINYIAYKGFGSKSTPYTGTFDGRGYSIKNLSVEGSGDKGLFNYVGNGGVVKNVVIESGTITANPGYSAGAIAGSINGGTITNCYNLGVDIDISSSTTSSCTTGGIVGYVSAGTISNCYNSGEVFTDSGATGDSTTIKSGGIAGHLASDAKIKECQNKGGVNAGSSNKRTYAGGIVGYTEGTVKDCLNNGTVKAYAKTYTSSGTINAVENGSYSSTTIDGKSVNAISIKLLDGIWDMGSSYSETVVEAYRGGIAGAMVDGDIYCCIDTTSTDYAVSGTSYSGWSKTTTLNYGLWNGTMQYGGGVTSGWTTGCRMDIEMKIEFRENYYNRFVGHNDGGTILRCASNSNTTMKDASIKITSDSYNSVNMGTDSVVLENQSWHNGSAVASIEIYIHTEDLGFEGSPSLCLRGLDGYRVYLYENVRKNSLDKWKGENLVGWLCYIDPPADHSDWRSALSRQSSVTMSSVTTFSPSIWALNGSTPELKGFYWKYNTDVPSED